MKHKFQSKKLPMKVKAKRTSWSEEDNEKLLSIENNIVAEILLGKSRQACSSHRHKLTKNGATSVSMQSYGPERAKIKAAELKKEWKAKEMFEYRKEPQQILMPTVIKTEENFKQQLLKVISTSNGAIEFIKVNMADGIKLNDEGDMLFTKFKEVILSEKL